MSEKNERNQWDELAEKMNELSLNENCDSENKVPSEPDLLEAAKESKKMFDAFTEAGFTSVQTIRLLAEIMSGGK